MIGVRWCTKEVAAIIVSHIAALFLCALFGGQWGGYLFLIRRTLGNLPFHVLPPESRSVGRANFRHLMAALAVHSAPRLSGGKSALASGGQLYTAWRAALL